ncbi:hypothetical protein V8D89_004622 [Ganoderma adspersum]
MISAVKVPTMRAIAARLRAPPSACFSTSPPLRNVPPRGAVGVARALQASPSNTASDPTIFTHEFSLADRVALVSGGHRGIGLEMALAFVEAGARAVYCVDLPKTPDEKWAKVKEFAKGLGKRAGGDSGRLEYISADVRDQDGMWKIGKTIGDREGRMDACVAGAGILPPTEPCLTYAAKRFQEVFDVNVNGALFTAQAAGQQMERFGNGGSIILIASVAAHGANKGYEWISYNSSKSAVLQMARSMACELGTKGIRVNSISPGSIGTQMTNGLLLSPDVEKLWAEQNPLGRIAGPHELRGVAVWLASDASSFCTGSDYFFFRSHTTTRKRFV